jgi:DnaJ-class molecular chaperone
VGDGEEGGGGVNEAKVDEAVCSACGCERDWTECPACGGDGAVSRYDEDPLWYHEDDLFTCETCQGRGGWPVCRNCFPIAG